MNHVALMLLLQSLSFWLENARIHTAKLGSRVPPTFLVGKPLNRAALFAPTHSLPFWLEIPEFMLQPTLSGRNRNLRYRPAKNYRDFEILKAILHKQILEPQVVFCDFFLKSHIYFHDGSHPWAGERLGFEGDEQE